MNAILEAERLTFGYGSREVVTGFDLTVNPGDLVAVTGPSGCGKSTLLYLLGLMVRPRTGTVLVEGRRAERLPDSARSALRAHWFGFVFQDALLDPTRSVLDNVMESALYRGDPRTEAVRRAEDLMDALDVAVPRRSRPGQISGGQAQRIALCRALLGRPRIVLADEPTGNLDGSTRDSVVVELSRYADAGNAVVIVTHDEEVAARCRHRIDLG